MAHQVQDIEPFCHLVDERSQGAALRQQLRLDARCAGRRLDRFPLLLDVDRF